MSKQEEKMSEISSEISKETENTSIIRLLTDPIRSRIFLEILLNKEVSTSKLLERINISKGTMSHHLTKLVNAGLLDVKVQSTGRPLKYYSLKKTSKIMQEENVVKLTYNEESKKSEKNLFFQSATAQLQMIANLMKDTESIINSEKNREKDIKNFAFTMNIFSSEAAVIAQRKMKIFIKELSEELKILENNEDHTKEKVHFFFSGLFPILTPDEN